MQPGYKRENKEVNCSLSEEEHVFPVAFDTALCSQVISNFWCAGTLHHTLYECGIPPLNSSCSYLSSQWHHLWRMDAEFPWFMYLQTFPNQILYWGLQGQSENKTGQVQAGRFLLSLLGVKMQDQKDLNCLWVSTVSADSNLFSVRENLKMDNMFQLNTSEMKSCLKTILRKYFKIL